MQGGEVLLDLLTAPMPVQVPPPPDVHQHIEDERVPAAELLDQLVVRAPLAERDLDGVLLLLLGPVLHHRQDVPVRRLPGAVQQGRGQFVQRVMRLNKIHAVARPAPGGRLIQAGDLQHLAPMAEQVAVHVGLVGVRLRMAGQRGGQWLLQAGSLAR